MDGLPGVLSAAGGLIGAVLTAWSLAGEKRSKAAATHYRAATRRLGLLRRVMSRLTGTETYTQFPADLRESLEAEVLGE